MTTTSTPAQRRAAANLRHYVAMIRGGRIERASDQLQEDHEAWREAFGIGRVTDLSRAASAMTGDLDALVAIANLHAVADALTPDLRP